MKKVFISILMAAVTLSAFAAETARVNILLTSTNATYGTDELVLKENSDRSAAYESGYDAEHMMSQANKHSVLIYAFVCEQPCSNVATDNLDGLNIGFTTNKYDTNYELVFENVSGRELTLYDRITNTQTVITNNGTYPFTAPAGRIAVNDRFYLNVAEDPTVYSVTTNEFGYATFSQDVDLTLPAGLKAYIGDINGAFLDMTEVDYIKADAGVIVKGDANQTYTLTRGTGASSFDGNDLKASALWTSSLQNVYCLNGNELRHYVGTDPVPAHKAFLQLTVSGPNPAPARISFRFGQTTAIDNVEAGAQTEKFIENGQVLIRRGNEVFNLQGQIVK